MVSTRTVSLRSAVKMESIFENRVPFMPSALDIIYSYGPVASGIVSRRRGFFHERKIDPLVGSVYLTLTFFMTGTPETRVEVNSFEALLSVPFLNTATIL